MSFKERRDIYGGITVQSSDLNTEQKGAESFSSILSHSLDKWKSKNVQGIWIRVDIKDSHIIPALVEKGFTFHHTQPDYLMMTKWLPERPCTLPRYAHTLIGAGGLVVDSQDRVLLMREKRGHYLGWKFPGGAAEPGENIFETAAREVFEETGVKAEAKAVLCFRQIDQFQYENVGDIFFLCVMDVLDASINPSPTETAECRWFTRDEVKSFPKEVCREYLHEMLARYDKWKASGRRGCHMLLPPQLDQQSEQVVAFRSIDMGLSELYEFRLAAAYALAIREKSRAAEETASLLCLSDTSSSLIPASSDDTLQVSDWSLSSSDISDQESMPNFSMDTSTDGNASCGGSQVFAPLQAAVDASASIDQDYEGVLSMSSSSNFSSSQEPYNSDCTSRSQETLASVLSLGDTTVSSTSVVEFPDALIGDLELINEEADREALRNGESVGRFVAQNSDARILKMSGSIRTWSFWNEVEKKQKQLIISIRSSTLSRRTAADFNLFIWNVISKACSSSSPRSADLQLYIQRITGVEVMLMEFFFIRGCREVAQHISQFVVHVFKLFLKKPHQMNELGRNWTQCREILRTICEIASDINVIVGILMLFRNIEIQFLKTMSADCKDRDKMFIAYVVEQLNDLTSRMSQRLRSLGHRDTYGIQA
ncbi:hypothetical protein Q1695_008923 [Nippostrongylus brasiliensis]|nr:hypothetical protein Q1695_008923 [Nippostrongylus brasiliensis]